MIDTIVWILKGTTFVKLGYYKSALKVFEEAIKIRPDDNKARIQKAALLYLLCDYETSQEVIEESLQIAPSAAAYYIKGKIKIIERKFDESIECFQKAKKIEPVDSMINIWLVYAKSLNAVYPPIVELDEDDWEKKISYQRDIATLIPELESIIKVIEDNKEKKEKRCLPHLYYWLSVFYVKLKDHLSAIENLNKCLDLIKNTFDKNYFKQIEKSSQETVSDCKELKRSHKECWDKAKELLKYIWNVKIRPSFWNWWLFPPTHLNKKIKRTFGIVTGILLFVHLFLFLFHPFFVRLIYLINPIFFPEKLEIDWHLWVASIISLFFILISPTLIRMKTSEIDIEISPPPIEPIITPVAVQPLWEEMFRQ